MFRKILVATDLTDASAPALRCALDLAQRLDSVVTAIHVIAPPYQGRRTIAELTQADRDYLRSLGTRERDAAARVLDDQVKAAIGEPGQRAVDRRIVSGRPADAILSMAAEVGADLIVLGTHGRVGLQHLVLGSIAERVASRATVPVLTVRASH